MSEERKVRVLRSAQSLIEEEFGTIGGKFEAEMANMADEMALLRSKLMLAKTQDHQKHQTRECLSTHSASSYSSSTRTTSMSSTATVNRKPEHGVCEKPGEAKVTDHQEEPMKSWLDCLDSPLIKESDEGRILKLRFDLRPYEPEQIVVKTVDNLLMVHAQLEQNGPQSRLRREYNREFLLPEGTKLELIKSSLSADGVLTVEAPLPGLGWLPGCKPS